MFAAFSRFRYRIFTIQGRLPDFSDSSNLWTGRQFGRRHPLCLCCRRSGAAAVCLQLHKETGALFKIILQLRWLCHLVGIICVESWAILKKRHPAGDSDELCYRMMHKKIQLRRLKNTGTRSHYQRCQIWVLILDFLRLKAKKPDYITTFLVLKRGKETILIKFKNIKKV